MGEGGVKEKAVDAIGLHAVEGYYLCVLFGGRVLGWVGGMIGGGGGGS